MAIDTGGSKPGLVELSRIALDSAVALREQVRATLEQAPTKADSPCEVKPPQTNPLDIVAENLQDILNTCAELKAFIHAKLVAKL